MVFPCIGRVLVRTEDLFAHDHDHIAARPDKIDHFLGSRLIADLVCFEASDNVLQVDDLVDRRID